MEASKNTAKIRNYLKDASSNKVYKDERVKYKDATCKAAVS